MSFIQFLYSHIPTSVVKKKKHRYVLFGINKGVKIYSELIFTQILGVYEREFVNRIRNNFKHIDSCLVLGMHNGYTAIELSKIYPDAKVIGVEANPNLCADIEKTLDGLRNPNIFLVQKRIDYGVSKFRIDNDGQGMVAKVGVESGDTDNQSSSDNSINDPLNPPVKFSELLKECEPLLASKKLLLMDIEGFEEDIFDNEQPEIFTLFDGICIEYHSVEIKDKYVTLFEETLGDSFKLLFCSDESLSSRREGNGHIIASKLG